MESLILIFIIFIIYILWKYRSNLPVQQPNPQPIYNVPAPHKSSTKTSTKVDPLLKGDGQSSISIAGTEHHTEALKKAFSSKIRSARKEWAENDEEIEESDCEDVDTTVTLVLEDANPHDSNAVAVMVRDNLIGYLPRGIAPLYRSYLQRNNLQGKRFRCKAQASIPLHTSGDDWDIYLDLPRLK